VNSAVGDEGRRLIGAIRPTFSTVALRFAVGLSICDRRALESAFAEELQPRALSRVVHKE
ncbi:MAG: hypothetical protein ACKVIW_10565, partial [bacterium]